MADLTYPQRFPELEPILKGSSFNQLWELLYFLYQLRYATKDHLNFHNNKLGTKKKLKVLVDEGFLGCTDNEYFFTGRKSLEILDKEGFQGVKVDTFFTGQAGKHQQKLTSVIFELMKEPFFYRCFYPPGFTIKGREPLIPDACIIYKDGERYKIEFLEVENEKEYLPWLKHLHGKKEKYEIKAKDFNVYDKWWRVWCGTFGLTMCEAKDFCFSIHCHADKDLGLNWEGWRFVIS